MKDTYLKSKKVLIVDDEESLRSMPEHACKQTDEPLWGRTADSSSPN